MTAELKVSKKVSCIYPWIALNAQADSEGLGALPPLGVQRQSPRSGAKPSEAEAISSHEVQI